jgi:hypothetical protein
MVFNETYNLEGKVKVHPEHAMKPKSGRRGIGLPFL